MHPKLLVLQVLKVECTQVDAFTSALGRTSLSLKEMVRSSRVVISSSKRSALRYTMMLRSDAGLSRFFASACPTYSPLRRRSANTLERSSLLQKEYQYRYGMLLWSSCILTLQIATSLPCFRVLSSFGCRDDCSWGCHSGRRHPRWR